METISFKFVPFWNLMWVPMGPVVFGGFLGPWFGSLLLTLRHQRVMQVGMGRLRLQCHLPLIAWFCELFQFHLLRIQSLLLPPHLLFQFLNRCFLLSSEMLFRFPILVPSVQHLGRFGFR